MEKAGDLLNNLQIFTNSSDINGKNYSSMFSSWELIVGVKLAGYSRIKDIVNQSLVVEADHPATIQLLQMKYGDILKRINKKYSELKIRDIRFMLKNPDIQYRKPEKNNPVFTGDEESDNNDFKAEVDINTIDNDNFRELLLKMKKRSQV